MGYAPPKKLTPGIDRAEYMMLRCERQARTKKDWVWLAGPSAWAQLLAEAPKDSRARKAFDAEASTLFGIPVRTMSAGAGDTLTIVQVLSQPEGLTPSEW